MRQVIEHLQTPPDTSFLLRVRDEPHFPMHWHGHANYELTLICQGAGHRYVGDHVEPYSSRDLVLVGPEIPHTWVSVDPHHSPSPNRAIIAQFDPAFLTRDFLQKPELLNVRKLLGMAGRGLYFPPGPASRASRRFAALPRLSGLARLTQFLRVLDDLGQLAHQAIPLASAAYSTVAEAGDRQLIGRAIAYIHAHIAEEITLDQAANAAGISRRSFARLFKRATAKTLMQYVNEVRVGRACAMLAQGQTPIAQVCYRSGFSSLPYFNRRFLASKGMTPSAYRARFNLPAHHR